MPKIFLTSAGRIVLLGLACILPACGGGGAAPTSLAAPAYQFIRAASPARTIVNTSAGEWLATYTDGSYTVRHYGQSRTFSEPVNPGVTAGAQTVTHTSYVRVLPSPWPSGAIPTAAQVDVLLASSEPDALAVAMQYIHGQPTVKVADANAYTGYLWVSGDAGYGPDIGADFNDHLGVSWDYGASYGGIDPNETAEYGLLDCSGFIRMVFGYRMGIPLAKIGHERPGVAIPRTSALQSSSGTSIGVGVIADTGRKPTSFDNLSPGDIVFFDADGADGTIDHVGIYLGIDSSGKNRVLSSRNSLLGPTMKDSASATSPSILDGNGWMPSGFRSARRF